jgi:hypothetical protein
MDFVNDWQRHDPGSNADSTLAHMLADSGIDIEQRVEVAESLSWTSGKTGPEALRNEIAAAN